MVLFPVNKNPLSNLSLSALIRSASQQVGERAPRAEDPSIAQKRNENIYLHHSGPLLENGLDTGDFRERVKLEVQTMNWQRRGCRDRCQEGPENGAQTVNSRQK